MPDNMIPAKVNVSSTSIYVCRLFEKMQEGQFDPWDSRFTEPSWTEEQQSRLIESILLKIPLPPLLFDASSNRGDKWNIIDGLQRLRTIAKYTPANNSGTNLMGEALPAFQGLQYFHELEGKTFAQVPRHYLRRYLETGFMQVFLIQYMTPDDVARNICERLMGEQGLKRYKLYHS